MAASVSFFAGAYTGMLKSGGKKEVQLKLALSFPC